jgi:hypothetical protein
MTFAFLLALASCYRFLFRASLPFPFVLGSTDTKVESTPLLAMGTHKGNALLVNPEIPFLIRYGTLLILLANVALFIASNTSLGAAVYLRVRTQDGVVQLPSLFNFSLSNSVRDMWNAGTRANNGDREREGNRRACELGRGERERERERE